MAAEHEIRRFNLAEVVLQPLVAGLPQPHALAAALAPSCYGPQRFYASRFYASQF
jgi:hypothetical protein